MRGVSQVRGDLELLPSYPRRCVGSTRLERVAFSDVLQVDATSDRFFAGKKACAKEGKLAAFEAAPNRGIFDPTWPLKWLPAVPEGRLESGRRRQETGPLETGPLFLSSPGPEVTGRREIGAGRPFTPQRMTRARREQVRSDRIFLFYGLA